MPDRRAPPPDAPPDAPRAARDAAGDPAARSILERMPVGAYRLGLDGGGLWVNPAARRMLGAAGTLPPWPAGFLRRLHAEGEVADFLRPWPGEGPDWVTETAWLERDASGAPQAIAGTLADATERMRAEARVTQAARHDALTGLPNRLGFVERLEGLLAGAGEGSQKTGRRTGLAVLLLDLDQFKAVNDTLGHPAGDALLAALAPRLAALVRPGEALARMGGDEFAVVLAVADEAEAVDRAARLAAAAGGPLALDGRPVTVGASVGLALAPRDGRESAALLQAADLALYAAKASGPGAVRVFAPALAAAARARRELEDALRAAVARQEFALVYQPILDAATRAVVGHEALLRWLRPGAGPVAAEAFIGAVEDLGLLGPLGAWALERACAAAAAAPASGSIWVNVSPVQLAAPGFEAALDAALAASALPPERLVIEITESAPMAGQATLAPLIDRLRARGLRTALDDFGAGYSALGYLSRFAFDVIKIDRSFVADLDRPDAAAIVGCVLDLARRLGVATVAEGVETEAQLAALRAAGCRYAQGHLFGPPREAPGRV